MTREQLLALVSSVPKPKLTHTNGIACVVTGERVTQFASEEAARLFVAAHEQIPALVATIDDLEKRIDTQILDMIVQELAAVTRERDTLLMDKRRLELLLEIEVCERTKAQQRARNAALLGRKLIDMSKRCQALQAAHDALLGSK
jgi:aspartate oxidase